MFEMLEWIYTQWSSYSECLFIHPVMCSSAMMHKSLYLQLKSIIMLIHVGRPNIRNQKCMKCVWNQNQENFYLSDFDHAMVTGLIFLRNYCLLAFEYHLAF